MDAMQMLRVVAEEVTNQARHHLAEKYWLGPPTAGEISEEAERIVREFTMNLLEKETN